LQGGEKSIFSWKGGEPTMLALDLSGNEKTLQLQLGLNFNLRAPASTSFCMD
jgi:sulfatase maturation enzyme AslB (radical SAM superfamily)